MGHTWSRRYGAPKKLNIPQTKEVSMVRLRARRMFYKGRKVRVLNDRSVCDVFRGRSGIVCDDNAMGAFIVVAFTGNPSKLYLPHDAAINTLEAVD